MSRSAIDLNPLPAEGAWASMRERFRSTQLGLSVKFQPNGASHRESGEPITTENLGYGQSVKVVADAVTQNMRSDKALAVIGPRAFGIEDTSPSWLVTKPAFSAPARWSATGSSALLQALKVYSIPLRVCAWRLTPDKSLFMPFSRYAALDCNGASVSADSNESNKPFFSAKNKSSLPPM